MDVFMRDEKTSSLFQLRTPNRLDCQARHYSSSIAPSIDSWPILLKIYVHARPPSCDSIATAVIRKKCYFILEI